jgi:hypothetical protein
MKIIRETLLGIWMNFKFLARRETPGSFYSVEKPLYVCKNRRSF